MKILLIAPWLPWPPHDGARIRIWQTLRFLASRHQVTLLTHCRVGPGAETHADETPVRELCKHLETVELSDRVAAVLSRAAHGLRHHLPLIQAFHWHPGLAQRIRQLTAQEAYDLVHIEFSYLAHYVGAVSPTSSAKTVLSMHNVESIRFARELRYAPWNGRRLALLWDHYLHPQWESTAVGGFDGILATSELEREWIGVHAPQAVVKVVPNGVDVQEYHMRAQSQPGDSLVFLGLMDYPPNVDAMEWFCQEVWPLLRQRFPTLRLTIVGRSPHPRVLALGAQPGVCVTGEVADVQPYVKAALALIVPLRSGGGTRLKILEAMAMGCPVISTKLGAEGLAVEPGKNILLAETAEQFAHQIERLMAAPEQGVKLAQAGRHLVTVHYDWPLCFRELDRLYDVLMSSEVA